MILATIIRLEMAYPGIGVLAGDSLQYLSVVTAHAVIMVFFMIMPLLFGAFGNFLLPTQLGVHDVAFPRLNSAAFWFLPGGLLMLAQLVCLDRRYQRMNCFNIRELQTLLKNRYHPELLDEKLHTDFLSQTVLSTRFKLFDLNTITPRMSLFNEFAVFLKPSLRSNINLSASAKTNTTFNLYELPTPFLITTTYLNSFKESQTFGVLEECDSFMNMFESTKSVNVFNTTYVSLNSFITQLENIKSVSLSDTIYVSLTSPVLLPLNSFIAQLDNLTNSFMAAYLGANSTPVSGELSSTRFTQLPALKSVNLETVYDSHELPSDYRFQKTQNPVFRYDFRVGNYMPDNVKVLNRHTFISFNDVTMGLRRAP